MGREEVYSQMKETLGGILSLFDRIPDELIDNEWELFKRLQVDETLIPGKYKGLTCLAVAAVVGSAHLTLFHTECARLNGATDSEIEETMRSARLVTGWATYLTGLQIDYGVFAEETGEMMAHRRRNGEGILYP